GHHPARPLRPVDAADEHDRRPGFGGADDVYFRPGFGAAARLNVPHFAGDGRRLGRRVGVLVVAVAGLARFVRLARLAGLTRCPGLAGRLAVGGFQADLAAGRPGRQGDVGGPSLGDDDVDAFGGQLHRAVVQADDGLPRAGRQAVDFGFGRVAGYRQL